MDGRLCSGQRRVAKFVIVTPAVHVQATRLQRPSAQLASGSLAGSHACDQRSPDTLTERFALLKTSASSAALKFGLFPTKGTIVLSYLAGRQRSVRHE